MAEQEMEALAESLPAPDFETDDLHPVNQPAEVGEDVWYVLQPRTGYAGQLEQRPAKIVKVWGSAVNLIVFVDGTNDVEGCSGGTYWATSRAYSKEPKRDTWHR